MTLRNWPEQREYERGLHHTERRDARRAWLATFKDHFESGKAAAEDVGMPATSLYVMAQRLGVALPVGQVGFKSRVSVDDVRRLAKRGLVARQIAAEIGCSAQRVRGIGYMDNIAITLERHKRRKPVAAPAPAPKPEKQSPMWEYAQRENAAMRRTGRV